MPPCLMMLFLLYRLHIIRVGIVFIIACNFVGAYANYQVFNVHTRFIICTSKSTQIVKNFQSFKAMEGTRNKWAIVSICCVSEHQYLDTIVILILFKFSSLEICPFQALQRKKFILNSIIFIYTI